MDPRVLLFRAETSVREAIARIRALGRRRMRMLFIVDAEDRLKGQVDIQDLAIESSSTRLEEVQRPVQAMVNAVAPREEVVEILERFRLLDLPVVNADERLIGVVRYPNLVAAAVVGLFEDTIAKYTALAVLLPVEAGQSGNIGAQALVVTMRGLALREIRARQWPCIVFKEMSAGFWNGVAIAATSSLGVWIWSHSIGLAAVVGIAMVVSMFIVGIFGAAIPLVLIALGQDPALSSSIVLTTVTDVVGFFSFLGIATLFSTML